MGNHSLTGNDTPASISGRTQKTSSWAAQASGVGQFHPMASGSRGSHSETGKRMGSSPLGSRRSTSIPPRAHPLTAKPKMRPRALERRAHTPSTSSIWVWPQTRPKVCNRRRPMASPSAARTRRIAPRFMPNAVYRRSTPRSLTSCTTVSWRKTKAPKGQTGLRAHAASSPGAKSLIRPGAAPPPIRAPWAANPLP